MPPAEATTEETTTTAETAPASGEQDSTAQSAPDDEAMAATPSPGVEAASSEADSAAEQKPDDEKKTEPPAGWKAVEAAKTAQLKLAKTRTELTQRETAIVQREQQFEQEIARANAWVSQMQQRESRIAEFERAVDAGDIDTLETKFGFSYAKLSARALEAMDPAGRVAKLEREVAERRQRDEQERVTNAQVEETRRDAQQLVAMSEHFVDDFPDLYTWRPERIAQEGIALRDATRRAGGVPTYDGVLRELQKRAKAEKDHEAQKRTSLEQRKRGTSEAGSAGNADPKGNSGSPTTTPALSGKTAAIRATPQPREKTEEEIDAECLAQLRSITKR